MRNKHPELDTELAIIRVLIGCAAAAIILGCSSSSVQKIQDEAEEELQERGLDLDKLRR